MLLSFFVSLNGCGDDSSTKADEEDDDVIILNPDSLESSSGGNGSSHGSSNSSDTCQEGGTSSSNWYDNPYYEGSCASSGNQQGSSSGGSSENSSDDNSGSSSGGSSGTSSEGSPDSGTPVSQDPVKSVLDSLVVSSVEELPACGSSLQGKGAVVEGDGVYICNSGEWSSVALQTEKKVACKDGYLVAVDTGKTVPSTSTNPFGGMGGWGGGNQSATNPPDSLIVRDVFQLNGTSLFATGASITITELDSTQFFRPTVNTYSDCITSKDGSFTYENPEGISHFLEVSITGFYRSPLTGNFTKSPVTFKKKVHVADGGVVHVDLLSGLTAPRVEQHIADAGGGRADMTMCNNRALRAVLGSFGIDTIKYSEENYFDALTAISVMMMYGNSDFEMTSLVSTIAEDIKGDGNWNDMNNKTKIADKMFVLDSSNGYGVIVRGMERAGYTLTQYFKDVLQKFWPDVLGLGRCGSMNAGQVTYVKTSMSTFFANDYSHKDNSTVRFICDKEYQVWRNATDIEKDTMGFGAGAYDYQIKMGLVSVGKYYIYENKTWRVATDDEVDGFTDVGKVYKELKSGDKLVIVVRHGERGDDTGKNGHLTTTGKEQSVSMGKKLSGGNAYFGHSGYARTIETAEGIAQGMGINNADMDEYKYLLGDWFVKDSTKLKNHSADGDSWVITSKYAFTGAYSDAYYDLDSRAEELIDEFVKLTSNCSLVILCSHDMLMVPLAAYASKGRANLRYYETQRWINYLAGIAVVIHADGTRECIPVKGLDIGSRNFYGG
ncbi:MAG: histidine phosphatase family protein [Fibrobacteraceae bacterium]|nr:histidine phosphatase family protein [Fibrobacteraceae bacterium]